MRPHRWMLTLAGWLVPRATREEWRAEWDAELRHRESDSTPWTAARRGRRFDLWRQSLGAFWDALWLRSSRWHSLRLFRRHWRLSATAVLSLGAALAAVTIGLSAYDVLLIRPPAVTDPASLRVIHLRTSSEPFGEASFPEFSAYRSQTRAFEDIAAFPFNIATINFTLGSTTFTWTDKNNQVTSTNVSDNFFQVLRIAPRLGALSLGSSASGDVQDVVISARFWRRLGGAPSIVGRVAKLNDQTVTIAGVAPDDFTSTGMLWVFQPDLWMSLKTAQRVLASAPAQFTDRQQRWLNMVGRLRPHISNAQALSDLQIVASRLAIDHPEADKGRAPVITPVSVTPPGERAWTASIVGSLVLVVFLVLVVACANVTNLLLGLSQARRHEMLVRAAFGASRAQLLALPLREGGWLGAISGLLGCGVGWLALRRVSTLKISLVPMLPAPVLNFSPGMLVLAVTGATAVLAGLAAGLGPALRGAADGLSGGINRELAVAEPRKSRFRNALVIVQMAVATAVLIGVGISIRSLVNLEHAPLGFSARNLVYIGVPDVKGLGYDAKSGPAFFQRLREHLLATRGIQAVTFSDTAPLTGYGSDRVLAEGETPGADGHGAETPYAVVDEHYFSTIEMPILSGRAFDSRDTRGRAEVIVVNKTLASRHWPGRNPIGQRLRIENGHRLVEVIGVVPDGKYDDLAEAPLPFMYFAMAQHYLPSLTIIARTNGPKDIVARSFASLTGMTDLLSSPIPTLDDALRLSLLVPRLIMWVIVGFGALAVALAGFGLYSTIYYAVSQRRKEIGIRMSLGARPTDLFVMVLRQTGGVALAGALIGMAIALALAPAASAIFYGIRPIEPAVVAAVVIASVALAFGTTYLVIRPWARLTAIDLLRR